MYAARSFGVVVSKTLYPGHMSIRVGDSRQCSEEIGKNLDLRLSIRLLQFIVVKFVDFD